MPNKKLTKAFKRRVDKYQPAIQKVHARMGRSDGAIAVSGKVNTIYVTELNGPCVEVLNQRVFPEEFGKLVDIGYDPLHFPLRRQVLSLWDAYPEAGNLGVFPHSHEIGDGNPDYIPNRRLLNSLVVPVTGSLTVQVHPATYKTFTGWKTYEEIETVDFSASVPISGARSALLVVDGNGDFVLRDGPVVANYNLVDDTALPVAEPGDNVLYVIICYAGQIEALDTDSQQDLIDLRSSGYASGSPVDTAPFDYNEGDVSNPPTEVQLITALGAPASVGAGKAFIVNDGGVWKNVYLAVSDGLFFWIAPLTRAAYVEPTMASASNAASYLTTPTYDGNGQAVHPSIYYNAAGWNGYKYWMAMTPYPGSDAAYENPSIIASNDGDTWVVPDGLTNPIAAAPGVGHNADTNLMVDPSGVMWLYYMQSDGSTADKIYVRSSSDGITWSGATELLSGAFGSMLSPSVHFDGVNYVMYYVDYTTSPNTLKFRTCTTPDGAFSTPSTATLTDAPAKDIWHMSIIKRGAVYHGFTVFCDSGTTGTGAVLYFAISNDGITWTISASALLSVSGGWDNNRIYASSGIITPTGYDLFYSAMTTAGNAWHIGRTAVTLS